MNNANDKRLFWACFIALIATAFGFIIRALIMDSWAKEFGLSPSQRGEIFGVGLWPFAISIVLFSLAIDKIGYGRAMVFAFVCHVASVIIAICAPYVLAGEGAATADVEAGKRAGYWMLYFGNFIVALGNGTVEAVINPVVATMFAREKTKWLNILHAGWPGGLVLGGLLVISMDYGGVIANFAGGAIGWQWKVGLLLIPVLLYGVMMLGCKFPVNERVAAGVSYLDMLKEIGGFGAVIVLSLIFAELARVAGGLYSGSFVDPSQDQLAQIANVQSMLSWGGLILAVLLSVGFGVAVRSMGRPLFVFLLIIMIPLATTELGTDSWISDLLVGVMTELGRNAGWVLVYTSFIMMVLRFYAGPIVHRLSPLGLLSVSSVLAIIGLYALSISLGWMIFVAATIYALGKTFFWPTMLGVVAEQFPKGGALTLNTIAGVGMLGVGVVGAQFTGYFQDVTSNRAIVAFDTEHNTDLLARFMKDQTGIFGKYRTLNDDAIKAATTLATAAKARRDEVSDAMAAESGQRPSDEALAAKLEDDAKYQDIVNQPGFAEQKELLTTINDIRTQSKRGALQITTVFPAFMLVCYLGLLLYYRSIGGYKAEVLAGHGANDDKFTGGVEGPVE